MKTNQVGLAAAMVAALLLGGCADTPDSLFGDGNGAATTPAATPPTAAQPAAQPRAQAQPQAPAGTQPQVQGQPRPPQQPQAAPTPNMVPQAAQRMGLNKCVPRIKQVTDFLTANTQHNGQMFVAPSQPDDRLASVAMELQSGNRLTYVNTAFDPGRPPNECGALYETYTYWDFSCADVAKRAYGSLKQANPLRQTIATLDGGPNLKIFLMPAGATGCVAIKKEMVYK